MEVESTLIDPAGKTVASAKTEAGVDPLKESIARFTLAVESPRLWSVDEPVLYAVRTVVKHRGRWRMK